MLTKQQADHLREQFKRATEYVWNQDKNELIATPIAMDVLFSIVAEYQIPAEDDLDCEDLPTHYYLEGVLDAVVTVKAAISEEAADLISIEMTAEEFMAAIEETIDVNIDYMLSGD